MRVDRLARRRRRAAQALGGKREDLTHRLRPAASPHNLGAVVKPGEAAGEALDLGLLQQSLARARLEQRVVGKAAHFDDGVHELALALEREAPIRCARHAARAQI